MESLLFSIITPSFNQGKFLEQTIQSVLEQKYPDLEYIIIDGGSTDNSVDIIKKYEPHLAYWISESDRGHAHAVNKGWQRATGDIWAFLNSDDRYLPGTFEKIVAAFKNHPKAGAVYGDCRFTDTNGKVIGIKHGRPRTWQQLLYQGQTGIIQPTCFFRAEVVQKVGPLNESYFMSFDYEFLLRIARVAELVYVPDILADTTYTPDIKSFRHPEGFHRDNLQIAKTYGRGLFLRHRWNHLRYRLLKMAPPLVQHWFRRRRNSLEDRVILRSFSDLCL